MGWGVMSLVHLGPPQDIKGLLLLFYAGPAWPHKALQPQVYAEMHRPTHQHTDIHVHTSMHSLGMSAPKCQKSALSLSEHSCWGECGLFLALVRPYSDPQQYFK